MEKMNKGKEKMKQILREIEWERKEEWHRTWDFPIFAVGMTLFCGMLGAWLHANGYSILESGLLGAVIMLFLSSCVYLVTGKNGEGAE